MRKILVTLLVVVCLALGSWCWAYRNYTCTVDSIATDFAIGDMNSVAARVAAFRGTLTGSMLQHLPWCRKLDERLVYYRALAHLHDRENETARELLKQLSQSTDHEVKTASLYNLAITDLSRKDISSAITRLRQALAVTPADNDAKYNLEILLWREQEAAEKTGFGVFGKDKMKTAPGQVGLSSIPPPPDWQGDIKGNPELWRYRRPEKKSNLGAKVKRRYL